MTSSPERRKKIIPVLCVLGFAVAHFNISFFVMFASGIGGNPALRVVSWVLTFPLWLIGGEGSGSDQTPLSWWPWTVLSLAWGSLITWGLYLLQRGRGITKV